MSRSRHTARASGGAVKVYSGGDSNVMKEAHERKRGGKVAHCEGDEMKARKDKPKRASGGAVAAATPARATGGAIGANKRPLSTAATFKKSMAEK